MNVLPRDKRAQILNCLVEGCSMRSTQRLTGVAKKTVERLLVSAGNACLKYQDKTLRKLNCKRLEVDEIWSFTYCKAKHVPYARTDKRGIGDTWTWFAIDAESKLIPCWRVDDRNLAAACLFLDDLKSRLNHRVQLTTDGLQLYVQAVEYAFGSNVDYAQLVKIFETPLPALPSRYSPPVCTGTKKHKRMGRPRWDSISTSYIERANLTLRMTNRRFTRLTNGYSKKIENHKLMLAISMMHYNFCRVHHSLRVTPAMEAKLTDHVWSLEEVAALIDS